jgi:L-seryl-tRNA(Ser) seleniumtransferase
VDPDSNPYRDLPPVDVVVASLTETGLPRPVLLHCARRALQAAREQIAIGVVPDVFQLASALSADEDRARPRPVINATGVLLHTNLGRAPLSKRAAEAARIASISYTNLELDLESGDRGGRGAHLRTLLSSLTGAEDALVVNNNAAAVLLAIAANASGRAVPVSRGELIEIGGSYRLPRVIEAGGARLVEVGTTNRTRLGDFETALQIHDCGAVLRVHPSNYRVEGFVAQVELGDLVAVAHDAGVPIIHDIGSGLLDKDAPWLGRVTPAWLESEPAVRQSIEAGVDLVTFSGDKLIGGPQAGIAVGSAAIVDRLRRHPLARALRTDASTNAALAVTLETLAAGDASEIPFWRMATAERAELDRRAAALADRIHGVVEEGASLIGAGSVPGVELPGPQVVLGGEDHLYTRLLMAERPILARRQGKDLVIDLRTVDPADDEVIAEMVASCR